MSTCSKQPDNWKKDTLIVWLVFGLILGVLLFSAHSCSPKIIYQRETVTEYRDRIVHDTATVEITKEIEKTVTKDTSSVLENKYAKSEAIVSQGLLHHSLESKPQIIRVPVEVHVTDTVTVETETKETVREINVEKPMTWWQKFRINAFWWLTGAVILALLWIFRKLIFKFL